MESIWVDYIVFGIVDNVVVLVGGVLGISIEALLPKRFKMGMIFPVICCGLANAISDFSGGAASLNWPLAFGTGAGCILAFIFLPVMLWVKKLKTKAKNNEVDYSSLQ